MNRERLSSHWKNEYIMRPSALIAQAHVDPNTSAQGGRIMITDAQVHLWEASRPDRPWAANAEAHLPAEDIVWMLHGTASKVFNWPAG